MALIIVVRTSHGATDAGLACLHDFATHDHFVKDLVNLVKVENQI